MSRGGWRRVKVIERWVEVGGGRWKMSGGRWRWVEVGGRSLDIGGGG